MNSEGKAQDVSGRSSSFTRIRLCTLLFPGNKTCLYYLELQFICKPCIIYHCVAKWNVTSSLINMFLLKTIFKLTSLSSFLYARWIQNENENFYSIKGIRITLCPQTDIQRLGGKSKTSNLQITFDIDQAELFTPPLVDIVDSILLVLVSKASAWWNFPSNYVDHPLGDSTEAAKDSSATRDDN